VAHDCDDLWVLVVLGFVVGLRWLYGGGFAMVFFFWLILQVIVVFLIEIEFADFEF
jgi:hypothetical protein